MKVSNAFFGLGVDGVIINETSSHKLVKWSNGIEQWVAPVNLNF
jgi:hypothetical protein